MGVFLANRANLQSKRLHDRIQNRLNGEFDTVRRRRAELHPYVDRYLDDVGILDREPASLDEEPYR